MKEELEKYENVEVYLTRQGDEEMSIKDRAAFAGEKGPYYAMGYSFDLYHPFIFFMAKMIILLIRGNRNP